MKRILALSLCLVMTVVLLVGCSREEKCFFKAEIVEVIDDIEYSINPNGVIYLMNGPAGTQTRMPVEIDETLYKYAERSNVASWAEFFVDGNTLTFEVKYYDGEKDCTYHKWGIKK